MYRLAQIVQYLLALHGTVYWHEFAPVVLAILKSYARCLEPQVIPFPAPTNQEVAEPTKKRV